MEEDKQITYRPIWIYERLWFFLMNTFGVWAIVYTLRRPGQVTVRVEVMPGAYRAVREFARANAGCVFGADARQRWNP